MSVIIKDLSKHYGTDKAVDGLSFEASRGRITGFLGPNGAGKSTTMKIATGYLLPTYGTVSVCGIPVLQDPIGVKRLIGYLPENNPLYPDMYVREFLGFVAKAYALKSRDSAIAQVIKRCGLSDHRGKKIRALSKGFRQRVGLAKALLPDPQVLILDEPTTGLDPNQIIEIRELIKAVSAEKTVILSSHIMQEVEAICDKVVIIDRGKLLADGPINELTRRSGNECVFRVLFEKTVDLSVFPENREILSVSKLSEKELEVRCADSTGRNRILKIATDNDLPLVSIREQGDSLEDVFKQLTATPTAP